LTRDKYEDFQQLKVPGMKKVDVSFQATEINARLGMQLTRQSATYDHSHDFSRRQARTRYTDSTMRRCVAAL